MSRSLTCAWRTLPVLAVALTMALGGCAQATPSPAVPADRTEPTDTPPATDRTIGYIWYFTRTNGATTGSYDCGWNEGGTRFGLGTAALLDDGSMPGSEGDEGWTIESATGGGAAVLTIRTPLTAWPAVYTIELTGYSDTASSGGLSRWTVRRESDGRECGSTGGSWTRRRWHPNQ